MTQRGSIRREAGRAGGDSEGQRLGRWPWKPAIQCSDAPHPAPRPVYKTCLAFLKPLCALEFFLAPSEKEEMSPFPSLWSWLLSLLPVHCHFRSALSPSPQELMADSIVPTSSLAWCGLVSQVKGFAVGGLLEGGRGPHCPSVLSLQLSLRSLEPEGTRSRIDGVRCSVPLPHPYYMSGIPDSLHFPFSSSWVWLPSHRHSTWRAQLTPSRLTAQPSSLGLHLPRRPVHDF